MKATKPFTPSQGLNGGQLTVWYIENEGDGSYTVAEYSDGSTWHSGYRAYGTWYDSYWTT